MNDQTKVAIGELADKIAERYALWANMQIVKDPRADIIALLAEHYTTLTTTLEACEKALSMCQSKAQWLEFEGQLNDVSTKQAKEIYEVSYKALAAISRERDKTI